MDGKMVAHSVMLNFTYFGLSYHITTTNRVMLSADSRIQMHTHAHTHTPIRIKLSTSALALSRANVMRLKSIYVCALPFVFDIHGDSAWFNINRTRSQCDVHDVLSFKILASFAFIFLEISFWTFPMWCLFLKNTFDHIEKFYIFAGVPLGRVGRSQRHLYISTMKFILKVRFYKLFKFFWRHPQKVSPNIWNACKS